MSMDAQTQTEIELSAVLDLFTYADVNDITPGTTLNTFIKNNSDNELLKRNSEFQMLKSAIEKHEEWGTIEIIHQSNYETPGGNPQKWTDDYIQAATFKIPKAEGEPDYYIAFRGTGDKRWPDNGAGLGKVTEMQRKSADYIDLVMIDQTPESPNSLGLHKAHDKGSRIIIGGHSKGGNECMVGTLLSDHADAIDAVYALDGQGNSEAGHAEMVAKSGKENFNKIYAINGKNDYVNGWGRRIASQQNTYYVDFTGSGIAAAHAEGNMLGTCNENNDGTYTCEYEGISWTRDSVTKEIINGEPGPAGKFVMRLNDLLFEKLPPEDIEGAATVFMTIIGWGMQIAHFKDYDKEDKLKLFTFIGDEQMTIMDGFDFLADGIPIIVLALFSDEGVNLLKSFLPNLDKKSIVALLTGLTVVFVADFVPFLIMTQVIDTVMDYAERIFKKEEDFIGIMKQISELAITFHKKVAEIVESMFGISKGAGSIREKIIVDTNRLVSYSNALKDIKKRFNQIESSIDGLYSKYGLQGLQSLGKANKLTAIGKRIEKCSSYLSDTAKEFDKVEKTLMRK